MAKAKINGVELNYHLDGEGEETVVILNGIMMSTASWADFVPVYTEDNDYRFLRVDFRDMGLSEKYETEYDISIHLDDLYQLLNHLKIEKVHLVGISYGGMVAMLFALKYPEKLITLTLSNTVARVTKYLQASSDLWEEAAKLNDGERFFRISMPLIYSNYFYNHNWDWLKEREKVFADLLDKPWFDSLIRLSKSSKDFDVFDKIEQIETPTLLIGGDRDILTPVQEMEKMAERIPNSKMIIIKDAGHASCYEKMDEFNLAVLGFIALHTSGKY